MICYKYSVTEANTVRVGKLEEKYNYDNWDQPVPIAAPMYMP